MAKQIIETEVLIVGTGPAGSACALALARQGIKPLVINKFGWTARTPRAHITNPRTMEVLHDLGVGEEAKRHAVPHDLMGENTFCASLAGPEFGRLRTWGTDPERACNYALASPETNYDITQNYMEPVLLGAAAHAGANVLFHTELFNFVDHGDHVVAEVRNNITGHEFEIRCQYLVGADGANSTVAEIAGLPFEGEHAKEGSMNIVFEADLSALVAHRPSVLYWIIQDGSDVGGLGMGVVRMVRPWHRWLAIWGYDLAQGRPDVDEEKAKKVVGNLVGDHDIPVEIDSISFWTVNEVYATKMSVGRVFCMGDAVHRHPPTKGLGSNTSIQDAYNLAWKLAMVLKGQAEPRLLDSFDQERAPIAKQVVTGANRSIATFFPVVEALGITKAETPDQIQDQVMETFTPTEEGAKKRAALTDAIGGTRDVFDNPGIEICHRYQSSAIASDGSTDPGYEGDPEVFFEPTTYPGARLPHAWVTRGGKKVSTLYLCGGGQFTVLTGNNGAVWEEDVVRIARDLGIDLRFVRVGLGLSVEDTYGDFARLREIQEDGLLLVRPDLHIGWRADRWTENGSSELAAALRTILGRA